MKKSIYRVRQETFCRKMQENKMEKALVTNPTNIFYLTGANIEPYERFMGFILDALSGKSHFIVPGFEKGYCRDEETLEVPYPDNEDPLVIAAALLAGSKRIGVDKKFLPYLIVERLLFFLTQTPSGAPEDIGEVDSFLEGMRIHKDNTELEKMGQAARYTTEILDKVKNKLRPGVPEQEIKLALFQSILQEKHLMGPASPIMVSSGIHSSLAHGMEGSRPMEPGDQVIIDFGVVYDHYRSDITRTFFVGQPKPEWEKIYRIVQEAEQKAIDTVRPGIAIKEVDLAARRHIEKAGYGPYFTTRVGHGLGLEIHEPPSIHMNNENIIQEGMVFTIEPGIYLPGSGGVRIEDDIAVTKEGVVILTQYSRELKDMVVAG